MARGDREWVDDIISAIADIRADTASTDFATFAAMPANARNPVEMSQRLSILLVSTAITGIMQIATLVIMTKIASS